MEESIIAFHSKTSREEPHSSLSADSMNTSSDIRIALSWQTSNIIVDSLRAMAYFSRLLSKMEEP